MSDKNNKDNQNKKRDKKEIESVLAGIIICGLIIASIFIAVTDKSNQNRTEQAIESTEESSEELAEKELNAEIEKEAKALAEKHSKNAVYKDLGLDEDDSSLIMSDNENIFMYSTMTNVKYLNILDAIYSSNKYEIIDNCKEGSLYKVTFRLKD